MNGHFIFSDIEKTKATDLEAILRMLPIIAKPDLTVEAEREADRRKKQPDDCFQDKIYFEVKHDVCSDEEEYVATPLRISNITGIARYVPTEKSKQFRIVSAWDDLLEVQYRVKQKNYIFSLFFKPH